MPALSQPTTRSLGPYFDSLPPELNRRIMTHLDMHALVILSRVSHGWHADTDSVADRFAPALPMLDLREIQSHTFVRPFSPSKTPASWPMRILGAGIRGLRCALRNSQPAAPVTGWEKLRLANALWQAAEDATKQCTPDYIFYNPPGGGYHSTGCTKGYTYLCFLQYLDSRGFNEQWHIAEACGKAGRKSLLATAYDWDKPWACELMTYRGPDEAVRNAASAERGRVDWTSHY